MDDANDEDLLAFSAAFPPPSQLPAQQQQQGADVMLGGGGGGDEGRIRHAGVGTTSDANGVVDPITLINQILQVSPSVREREGRRACSGCCILLCTRETVGLRKLCIKHDALPLSLSLSPASRHSRR